MSVKSVAHLKLGFVFVVIELKSSLFVLDIHPFPDIGLVFVFSHSIVAFSLCFLCHAKGFKFDVAPFVYF